LAAQREHLRKDVREIVGFVRCTAASHEERRSVPNAVVDEGDDVKHAAHAQPCDGLAVTQEGVLVQLVVLQRLRHCRPNPCIHVQQRTHA
jgi:hypothetical protein